MMWIEVDNKISTPLLSSIEPAYTFNKYVHSPSCRCAVSKQRSRQSPHGIATGSRARRVFIYIYLTWNS